MREWQQPLSEEKIAWLQEQFEKYRIKIEAMWGSPGKPWRVVRLEAVRNGLLNEDGTPTTDLRNA